MLSARQVKSDVKFPLSLINTYQLDKHHPDAMKVVLLSQGIALELADIINDFAAILKSEECGPLLECVGKSLFLARLILVQPQSTRNDLRRLLKEKPKDLKTFMDPVGAALETKNKEDLEIVDWGRLLRPLLKLHLESKIDIAPIVPLAVKDWIKALSAAEHGSNQHDIFYQSVVNSTKAELFKHHKDQTEEMIREINLIKENFTFEFFLRCQPVIENQN